MFLIVIYNLSILNYPRISSIKNLSRHNPRLCRYSDWLKKSSSAAASHMICKDCCDLERYFPVNLQDRDVFRIWSQGWCDSRNLVVRSTEPSRFMIFTWIKLLTVTFPTPIEDYPLFQIIIFDDIHYLYYTGPFLQSLKKITIKIILVLYFFMNHNYMRHRTC